MQWRPSQLRHRRERRINREQLGRTKLHRLQRADLVVDPVELLLLSVALFDDRKVALERSEVALNGGFANVELLGEILNAAAIGRIGEQPEQRPLPDELLGIGATGGEGERGGGVHARSIGYRCSGAQYVDLHRDASVRNRNRIAA